MSRTFTKTCGSGIATEHVEGDEGNGNAADDAVVADLDVPADVEENVIEVDDDDVDVTDEPVVLSSDDE